MKLERRETKDEAEKKIIESEKTFFLPKIIHLQLFKEFYFLAEQL
jgi:hypothetical protein